MKFGALYNVYEDDSWLIDSFMSVYAACDAIYFVISDMPWNGPKTDNSRLLSTVDSLPDPEKKVKVIKGSWGQTWVGETAQRNYGLELLQKEGMDYAFIVDGDEIYDTDMLKNMMQYASDRPQIECWHSKMDTYWKSHQYVIRPREPCTPEIFVRLGTARFTKIRSVNARTRATMPPEIGFYHHMSYARNDEQLQKKISMFSHADEIVPNWYTAIWKGWDDNKEMINLHPTCPPCYARAVPRPIEELPPVLRKRFGGK